MLEMFESREMFDIYYRAWVYPLCIWTIYALCKVWIDFNEAKPSLPKYIKKKIEELKDENASASLIKYYNDRLDEATDFSNLITQAMVNIVANIFKRSMAVFIIVLMYVLLGLFSRYLFDEI